MCQDSRLTQGCMKHVRQRLIQSHVPDFNFPVFKAEEEQLLHVASLLPQARLASYLGSSALVTAVDFFAPASGEA